MRPGEKDVGAGADVPEDLRFDESGLHAELRSGSGTPASSETIGISPFCFLAVSAVTGQVHDVSKQAILQACGSKGQLPWFKRSRRTAQGTETGRHRNGG